MPEAKTGVPFQGRCQWRKFIIQSLRHSSWLLNKMSENDSDKVSQLKAISRIVLII